jgi:hypothetical protein
VGLDFGQSLRAWLFCLFSKSPTPILLNKHPCPQKTRARSINPKHVFCKPYPALVNTGEHNGCRCYHDCLICCLWLTPRLPEHSATLRNVKFHFRWISSEMFFARFCAFVRDDVESVPNSAWPDWPNFQPMGDRLLWTVTWKLCTESAHFVGILYSAVKFMH